MKNKKVKRQWLLCPVCRNKTRLQIRSDTELKRHRAGDLQLRNCNYRLILFKERTIYAKDRIYNIKPPILFCLNKGVKTQNQS